MASYFHAATTFEASTELLAAQPTHKHVAHESYRELASRVTILYRLGIGTYRDFAIRRGQLRPLVVYDRRFSISLSLDNTDRSIAIRC